MNVPVNVSHSKYYFKIYFSFTGPSYEYNPNLQVGFIFFRHTNNQRFDVPGED